MTPPVESGAGPLEALVASITEESKDSSCERCNGGHGEMYEILDGTWNQKNRYVYLDVCKPSGTYRFFCGCYGDGLKTLMELRPPQGLLYSEAEQVEDVFTCRLCKHQLTFDLPALP